MDRGETSFNEMQTVKRRFFAMRNGIIADTLRRNGSPFKIIFGLNLPQIAEIASSMPKSDALAERLWANSTTRESMLIAPQLVVEELFSEEDAHRWIADIPAFEIADVLCLKLLKRRPYAAKLAVSLSTSEEMMDRYTGLRLMFNIMPTNVELALQYAEKAIQSESDGRCRALAMQLRDECRWMLEA